ncbi:hypothetical protein C5167_011503 [Papaver somniferum]|uniref:2Fe-2S ferredoxin-type domain-containing protein n=1 Tax=Papaver somniferum TaxID=3469 RepID=A0A4Y7K6I1_PAPSO|nr:hypothetical protein C5167_011503 [Papaver somniferum]
MIVFIFAFQSNGSKVTHLNPESTHPVPSFRRIVVVLILVSEEEAAKCSIHSRCVTRDVSWSRSSSLLMMTVDTELSRDGRELVSPRCGVDTPRMKPKMHRSRLGCQVIARPELDGIRLALPAATRNFAVDGHVPKPH